MKPLRLLIAFLLLGSVVAASRVAYARPAASPPTISKVFGAATIPLNGTTSLAFTVSNPNGGVAFSGVAFSDTLPSGLIVATPNGLLTACNPAAITATAGSSTISLSGSTLPASGSCTYTVNVTGTTAGVKNNVSGNVTSTEGGTGNTASASIAVVAPPIISKAFTDATIPLNGNTRLSITVSNPNAGGVGGPGFLNAAFTDTLPSGLVIGSGLTNLSCGDANITGGGPLPGFSAFLSPGGECILSIPITGTTAGVKNNTTSAITSIEGGTGNTASASITVVAPPTISKAFNPTTISVFGTTNLTFTITNPNATVALAGVAFIDTLPTGLTVASSVATACGGTLTTTAPTGIALSGASIAAASQCQFSLTVTGAALASYTNTTGAVSSTNGGTGGTASAILLVAPIPVVPTLNDSGRLIFGLLIAAAGLLLLIRKR